MMRYCYSNCRTSPLQEKENLQKNIEIVSKKHYRKFCLLAYSHVSCSVFAEDMVQDVLVKILANDNTTEISNLKGYIWKSVGYSSLKQIKRSKKFTHIYDSSPTSKTPGCGDVANFERKDPIRIKGNNEGPTVQGVGFRGLRPFDINRWQIGEVDTGLLQGMHFIDETSGEWKILDYGQIAKFNPDKDYCRPIPQKEMDINDVAGQNPGYTK